ncbi:MAG TPA: pseudouridine synthase [Geobacterales bacterium]|nr:pseudouridine synthase [Geobacterales bacterium]
MRERLQKILAKAGVASRRKGEELIVAGRVSVNGIVVTELGSSADPELDTIAVDGKPVQRESELFYILLNKPVGYVTTLSDPQGRPVVTDLVKGIPARLFPVGRLDYNTEGLLLLTNDGDWANRLAHPRHGVEKEYWVRIRGSAAPAQLRRLSEGVELDDGKTSPARVRVVREAERSEWISLIIHEGRYRQVRRMFEAVSLSVVRLRRVRYGILGLGEMKIGEYRSLTPAEVATLRGDAPRAKVERKGEKKERPPRRKPA